MMSFKVLHVSPYYLPDVGFGGPVFSVSALCEALAAKGASVTVFTVGYDNTGATTYPLKKELNGVSVVYFKRDWGSPCQVSYQLWEALRQEAANFGVIHLNTWWNILIFKAIQIIRPLQVPTIISLRGMLGDYSFTHRKTFLKRWFQQGPGNRLLAHATLLATSEAEAREISRRTGRSLNSIAMLPNLLGLQHLQGYSAPPKGFKLGFLSRLHHKKGIEVLLDAVALCPMVDELVIGGGGDPQYEQQLRQQVASLGIGHRVRFIGWVTQQEKAAFFSQFHIFILPSFHENFANVVAEAWAAGKPVVISRQVGLSNFVEKYDIGWICEPDKESTAEAIRRALENRERWPEMGKVALELVATQLTDSQIVNDYLALYQSKLLPAAVQGNNANIANGGSPATDSYILGINAYHADASAALLHNGVLVAAIEEERFRRIKHWAGFPSEAVRFCLQEAGITASQITQVAVGRDPKAKWAQKAMFAMQNPGAMAFAVRGRLSNAAAAVSVEEEMGTFAGGANSEDFKDKIVYVEHHRCHLASAFYASPFTESALLSIDGSGDFSTTMMGVGRNGTVEVMQSIDFPHSLGIFYTAFTQLLGFPHYGDEYKVMGLASFGKPVYAEELSQVVRLETDGSFRLAPQWFRPPGKGYVMYDDDHRPQVPILFSRLLEEKFGPERAKDEPVTQRHMDLAASVQYIAEQTIFHLLRHLHAKTGLDTVCIAGGVAQNSVANGKITQNTPFKKVFIPPAGHDAGLSIGAAMYVCHHMQGMPRPAGPSTPYMGNRFTNSDILSVLQHQQVRYELQPSFDTICEETAACIAQGGVVGWFRGRCEFGPRALGNRSILADPRRADAKQLLNDKIKRRELFRPFAPSILKEFTAEYFEQDDDVPFMEKVFLVKKEKRAILPAVTHVDGSGRLQAVSKEMNADFYQLIDTFRAQTGIPVLLNTSFNENEPIVNTPTDALNCFLRTRMDMLVLEDFIITRGNNL